MWNIYSSNPAILNKPIFKRSSVHSKNNSVSTENELNNNDTQYEDAFKETLQKVIDNRCEEISLDTNYLGSFENTRINRLQKLAKAMMYKNQSITYVNFSGFILPEKIDVNSLSEKQKCLYFMQLCAERNREAQILRKFNNIADIEQHISEIKNELPVLQKDEFEDLFDKTIDQIKNDTYPNDCFLPPQYVKGGISSSNSQENLAIKPMSEQQLIKLAQAISSNYAITRTKKIIPLEESVITTKCLEIIEASLNRNFLLKKQTSNKVDLQNKVFDSIKNADMKLFGTIKTSTLKHSENRSDETNKIKNNKTKIVGITLFVLSVLLAATGAALAATGVFSPLGFALSLIGYKLAATSATIAGIANFGAIAGVEMLLTGVGLMAKAAFNACFSGRWTKYKKNKQQEEPLFDKVTVMPSSSSSEHGFKNEVTKHHTQSLVPAKESSQEEQRVKITFHPDEAPLKPDNRGDEIKNDAVITKANLSGYKEIFNKQEGQRTHIATDSSKLMNYSDSYYDTVKQQIEVVEAATYSSNSPH